MQLHRELIRTTTRRSKELQPLVGYNLVFIFKGIASPECEDIHHGYMRRKPEYKEWHEITSSNVPNAGGTHSLTHLIDPGGTLEMDSLSMVLYVTSFVFSSVFPVQLTGTRTEKARMVMGKNIFNLHYVQNFLRNMKKENQAKEDNYGCHACFLTRAGKSLHTQQNQGLHAGSVPAPASSMLQASTSKT